MPTRGNIDYDQIRSSARQGVGAKFQMFNSSPGAKTGVLLYDANGDALSLALPNDASKYLDGSGAFSTPGGGGGGSGLVLLEQHTASSSASLDFTTFSSTYDEYLFEGVGLVPGTTSQDLWLRISTDGGSTFLTAGNYHWVHWTQLLVGGNGGAGTSGDTRYQVTDASRMVTTAGTSTSFTLRVTNMLSSTNFTSFYGTQHGWISATVPSIVITSGGYAVANTANAVRFLMSSGNIASGVIRLYGFSK